MKRTRRFFAAFTLIELMLVISIIMVLAGLTLFTVSSYRYNAKVSLAKNAIAALSLKIEAYRIDNGDVPRSDATDVLDARLDTDATSAVYKDASLTLYVEISGDVNLSRTPPSRDSDIRAYWAFPPWMIPPGTSVEYLSDPFNNAFGYSTKYSADVRAGSSDPGGFNPTFDLWCTSDIEQTGTTPRSSWLTNW